MADSEFGGLLLGIFGIMSVLPMHALLFLLPATMEDMIAVPA